MERLTRYVSDVPIIDTTKLKFHFMVDGKIGGDIADRLAAYEDTGLTLEEIAALKAENERLHKENFWLTDGQAVVLCQNCRSGGRCQMERNFRSEGIAEPFCCRGEVRGDG